MTLSDISIGRPVLALMVTLALVIFGAISYREIPIENMPNVEFPFLTIQTVYPGANPETVESEVTKPIEDEVATLSGIKELTSTSAENVSLIFIEYELNVDINVAAQDVRDRMARLQQGLPEGVKTPIVEKIDVMSSSVVDVSVSGEGEPQDLAAYVNDYIKPRLEAIAGVGSVHVQGIRDREIRIWLDSDLMASYGVSPQQVVYAIQSNQVDIPGGRIETGAREFSVVTSGKLQSVAQFNDLVVATIDGSQVRLRDVARVEDGLADLRSLARLNGLQTIGLSIIKTPGANEIRVADSVYVVVDQLRAQIPPGIKIDIPKDNSTFVRDSFNSVKEHIFGGAGLAILVVLLFLGSFRTTLIAAVTIPTSIITTFIFMQRLGFSLNNITMLAFSLMVGMLVDDAIVVLENIYRHAERGQNPVLAAKEGSREITMAVLATTLSIIAVFIPVAFMKGIIGRFMYQYGITVAVGVSGSYIVAMTLAPMLASQLRGGRDNFVLFKMFDAGFKKVEDGYRRLIGSALRHKWLTILVAIIAMVAALVLFAITPKEFESKMDQGFTAISIEMPVGTSLQTVNGFAKPIEDIVMQIPEVENVYTTLGAGTLGEQNKGNIYIGLKDKRERDRTVWEIEDEIRGKIEGIAGAKILVSSTQGWGTNYEMTYELTGNNADELRTAAMRLEEAMSQNPAFREVDTTLVEGKPEVDITLNRDRVADMGLNAVTIGSTLRLLVSGEDVITTFTEGGHQYDVKARLESGFRDRPEDLNSILVYPNDKDASPVEVSSIASIDVTSGASEISHSNKMRSITVLANLAEGHVLGEGVTIIDELAKNILPSGIRGRHVGMAQIMAESFSSIGFTLVLGIVLIYLILAAQYNHFIHPLTIMTTLPLSFIGAFVLLFLAHMTINMLSLMGVIMLMGLVTKNAILVVEFTNQLRRKGMPRDEALMTAGPVRLRPVIMTTMSTIMGMLPVALMLGGGAGVEFRAPMAVAVIGGLITSTLLTLIVVPVTYALLDNATNWFLRKSGLGRAYASMRETQADTPDDQIWRA